MAANPNVGAEAQSGAEGTPSQSVSQPAQPPIEGNVTQLLAGLGDKLGSLESQLRGLQGRQDKTENNFQAQLAKYQQYTKQGLKHEEALYEMQSDEVAEQRWQKVDDLAKKLDDLAARFNGGGTPANGQQQKVAEVFESIGLDVKDPRVASALLTKYESTEQVELAAYRLSRQIQQSPNPNPAQSPSLQSGGNAGVNVDALAQEYDALMRDPSANFQRMSEIQQELDKIK
jgi:hypothetical protein